MNSLGNPYTDNPEWFTFNSLTSEPTRLRGYITVPLNASETTTYNSILKSLDENNEYNGVPILSVNNVEIQGGEEETSEEANLGLILGLSIPLLLILLSLILIIKTNSAKEVEPDDDPIESNK